MTSSSRPVARLFVAAVALVIASCAPAPAPVPQAPAPFASGRLQRVVVYGDSLTTDSQQRITAHLDRLLPGWDVVVRHRPGSAQCDWHHRMNSDEASLAPAVVVLAFFGNHGTACSAGRSYPELYADDARWAINTWKSRGTKVAVIGAPPAVGDASNPAADVYRDTAAAMKVPFVSTASLFVDPNTGRAAPTMPCLSGETAANGCADGRIRVRHREDNLHLCNSTATSSLGGCTTFAAGAERYARSIADAALAASR